MENYLGLAVIAAIVTTLGSLTALFLKDFLLVHYFENQRERRDLKKVSKRYKDPLLLTASELARRISEIISNFEIASNRFTSEILFDETRYVQSNSATDRYFMKYKLASSIYRFSSFFGWIELYRQDITFLESHSWKQNSKLFSILEKIRSSLADGQLNTEPDWMYWKDSLIFREELRAVGEGMIEHLKDQRIVMGYGKFQSMLSQYEDKGEPVWLRPVINFFLDLKLEKDFRQKRMSELLSALRDLIKYLDKEYYNQEMKGLKPVIIQQLPTSSI